MKQKLPKIKKIKEEDQFNNIDPNEAFDIITKKTFEQITLLNEKTNRIISNVSSFITKESFLRSDRIDQIMGNLKNIKDIDLKSKLIPFSKKQETVEPVVSRLKPVSVERLIKPEFSKELEASIKLSVKKVIDVIGEDLTKEEKTKILKLYDKNKADLQLDREDMLEDEFGDISVNTEKTAKFLEKLLKETELARRLKPYQEAKEELNNQNNEPKKPSFLGETINKIKDKTKDASLDMVSNVKSILKDLGKQALIIGSAAAAINTIQDGTVGYNMAEKLGVSKASGAIGFALGGLDSGIMNAMNQAGKYAAMGAVAGSFVPGIGTIFGGLLGAGFGAIMGYFGGEKIAKFVDGISTYVSEGFDKVYTSITGFFDSAYTAMKSGVLKSWNSVRKTFGLEPIGETNNNTKKPILTDIKPIGKDEVIPLDSYKPRVPLSTEESIQINKMNSPVLENKVNKIFDIEENKKELDQQKQSSGSNIGVSTVSQSNSNNKVVNQIRQTISPFNNDPTIMMGYMQFGSAPGLVN